MIRSAQTAASVLLIPAFRKGLATCIRALPPTLAMTTRYGWTLVPAASLHSGDLRYLNPLRPSNRSGSAILGLKPVQAAAEEERGPTEGGGVARGEGRENVDVDAEMVET